MLVLARHPGERLLIQVGDVRIWITVVDSSGYRAKLGFEAPRNVSIFREEIVAEMDGKDSSSRTTP
jgi:carbon storage regulator CsrA